MALVINLLSVESFDSWSKYLTVLYRSLYGAEIFHFTEEISEEEKNGYVVFKWNT
jgi:hypothetical protein